MQIPRTVVVEDHPVFRSALVELLAGSGRLDVVADFDDVTGVAAHVAAHPVDLVVCDMHLPSGSGLELCRELRALERPPQVCVLSADCRLDAVLAAREAGAAGFVQKGTGPDEVVALLVSAAAGEPAYDPASAGLLAAATGTLVVADHRLAPRDLEVLRALAAGHEGDDLGARLGTDAGGAAAETARVLALLGVPNAAAAVAWAMRAGAIV